MDPFTVAALSYISVKVGEKIFDKALDTGIEKVLPKQKFKERIRVVIQNTIDQFEIDKLKLKGRLFPFTQSEALFTLLLEKEIYSKKPNSVNVNDFNKYSNIIEPDQADLDIFFDLFLNNIKGDEELRKLYVEEYYKETIFKIKEDLVDIKEAIDQAVQNTTIKPLLIRETKSTSNSSDRFNYRVRTTSFIGRVEEVNTLTNFFLNDDKFSWWLITGKGGSGKSRLALELCIELEKLNLDVEAGILSVQQIDSLTWNNWHPTSPQLFIVDFAASNHSTVLGFIEYLTNRVDLKVPVKLLLIERDIIGDWWEKLMYSYDAKRSCFDELPLKIEGLQGEFLVDIVKQVLVQEGATININDNDLKEILYKIDYFRRPLFSMFVAIALSNGQHIRDWNQFNLLDYQLAFEYELITKRYPTYSENTFYQHKNLLILSTICYGLNSLQLEDIFSKNLNWLPSADTLDYELYNALSGYSADGGNIVIENYVKPHNVYLVKEINPHVFTNADDVEILPIIIPPLLPDVLGEYFVLKNVEDNTRFKNRDVKRLDQIKDLSFKLHSYYFHIFIWRILQDFPGHEKISNFLKEPPEWGQSNKGANGQIILDLMRGVYSKDEAILHKLWTYTRELDEGEAANPASFGFMDDPHRVYQNATLIMMQYYAKDYDKLMHYYSIIRENTERFSKRDPIIVALSSQASLLDNPELLEHYFSGIEDPELAQKYLEKNTASYQLIPHLEACAIEIIINSNTIQDSTISTRMVDRLTELCRIYTDPRIKNILLDSMVKYGPERVELFDSKIETLFSEIIKTPKQVDMIDVNYETFTFVNKLVNYYAEVDKDKAHFYFYNYSSLLMNKKASREVGFTLVNILKLACLICKKYYESKDFVHGDLYYRAAHEIALRLGQFGGEEITNLVSEIRHKRMSTYYKRLKFK